VQQGTTPDKMTAYHAEVVPWFWFMTLSRDCRIFHKKTVPDIIAECGAKGIRNAIVYSSGFEEIESGKRPMQWSNMDELDAALVGHETDTGGWVNYWNVMSVPDGCDQAQARFHGIGNHDPELGATETLQATRFSRDAIERMDLSNIVSIHTGEHVGPEL